MTEPLSYEVIGAAIEVHRCLGPGLLESAYEQCLRHELTLRNVPFLLQQPLPLDLRRPWFSKRYDFRTHHLKKTVSVERK